MDVGRPFSGLASYLAALATGTAVVTLATAVFGVVVLVHVLNPPFSHRICGAL